MVLNTKILKEQKPGQLEAIYLKETALFCPILREIEWLDKEILLKQVEVPADRFHVEKKLAIFWLMLNSKKKMMYANKN